MSKNSITYTQEATSDQDLLGWTRSFLSAYVDQWRPPQPLEKAWPPSFQASGPLPPRSDLESVAGGHQGD